MKKIAMMLALVVVSINIVSAAVLTTDTFVSADGHSQFDIEFVAISGDNGDLGSWSAGSGYTFSGVNHGDYRMGRFEISNDQYAKFAANNPYFTFTGGGVSANKVTWFEAAKFVNYLNTSTGNQAAYKFTADVMGIWEDGDDGYDADNPLRNSNAKYFLPTEDEWVKAAYWNGTSLQTYATKPGESLTQGDGSGTGWNYYESDSGHVSDPYGPWNIGSGSEELNGTKNMMGNVWEWMESSYINGAYTSDSNRSVRGGSCYYQGTDLSSSGRINVNPYSEYGLLGFRVASEVPEPCSLVLLGLGGLMLRRRKA